MTRATISKFLASALALVVASATPSVAQQTDTAAQLTLYGWATGLSGEIRPLANGPKLEFDSDFGEVLEDLDAAFFLSGFARYGSAVFLGDLSTSTSSREGSVPPGIPARGEVTQTSVTLAAGYRAQARPDWTIDFLLGARFWDIEGEIDASAVGIGASRSVSFADPIVAARTNLRLADRWSFLAYGDVGGFGIGSERTGQFVGTVNYAATDRVVLSAGYRQLYVDYEDDGVELEVTFAGPVFGATFRF